MLMMHVDSESVDQEALHGLPVPEPTPTWQPVAHEAFERLVRQELEHAGIEIVRAEYGLSRPSPEGFRHRLFGMFETQDRILGGQVGMAIGFRNSTDQSLAAGLAYGARVFVCDNRSFSGEVVLCRRHTTHILQDLPGLVAGAVERYAGQVDYQQRLFGHWETLPVGDEAAYGAMVEGAHAGVIPYSRIKHVRQQWHEPSYAEFGPRTVWSLFNAFTDATRRYDGLAVSQRTLKLTAMFRSRFGVGIAN